MTYSGFVNVTNQPISTQTDELQIPTFWEIPHIQAPPQLGSGVWGWAFGELWAGRLGAEWRVVSSLADELQGVTLVLHGEVTRILDTIEGSEQQ